MVREINEKCERDVSVVYAQILSNDVFSCKRRETSDFDPLQVEFRSLSGVGKLSNVKLSFPHVELRVNASHVRRNWVRGV